MPSTEVTAIFGGEFASGASIAGTECLFVDNANLATVTIAYSGRSLADVEKLFPLGKPDGVFACGGGMDAYLTNGIPELVLQLASLEVAPTGTPTSIPTPGAIASLSISLGGFPAGPVTQYELELTSLAMDVTCSLVHFLHPY